MPFSSLMRDEVSIHKQDGSTNGPYRCSVQTDSITIMDNAVDVEEGDSVERQIPNGKVETYTVLDAEFVKGLETIPDSWQLHVRKNSSLKPTGGRTTNIHIENATSIQIGDYNVQHVSSVLQSLMHTIDSSNVPTEQKKEAKSRLVEFLKHPAVSAALGSGVSALIKSILGS